MKEEKMTVYTTSDGQKFFEQNDARRHEEILKNTRAYEVRYCPDLTETGTLSKKGYLIVCSRWSHDLWAEDWLYKTFGSRVAFVQGVSPCLNWSFNKVDLSEVNENELLNTIRK